MFWTVSEGVKKFTKSIVDNHNDWKQQQCRFTNTKTGLSIWTASGISHLKIEGQDNSYWTAAEKRYIYKGILECIRLQIEYKGYPNK